MARDLQGVSEDCTITSTMLSLRLHSPRMFGGADKDESTMREAVISACTNSAGLHSEERHDP